MKKSKYRENYISKEQLEANSYVIKGSVLSWHNGILPNANEIILEIEKIKKKEIKLWIEVIGKLRTISIYLINEETRDATFEFYRDILNKWEIK